MDKSWRYERWENGKEKKKLEKKISINEEIRGLSNIWKNDLFNFQCDYSQKNKNNQ